MIFNLPYTRQQYLNFFQDGLLPEDFEICNEKVEVDFKSKFIKHIIKIGESPSLEMNVYEITHQSENDPRISLSRESFRLLSQYGIKRALILFVTENHTLNYRLSLITIDLKWEEGTQVKKEYSNPHRYSFYLGPGSKTHTPEYYLLKKGRVKDFEDLKGRFSIEVVNKDFYTEIARLFTELAGGERTIGKRKITENGSLSLPSTSDDTVKKEFAVRLIGRLIFCWFLKKKNSNSGEPLIPERLLSTQSIKQNQNFYHTILEPLFFGTLNSPLTDRNDLYAAAPWNQIPFLNGGIFEPGIQDYYTTDSVTGLSKYINTLRVPDEWLLKLLEIFETYNFTIDENTSVDIELSIEPEMLGRIFENLLAEINPETGDTARKATGSYYTPRPIVDFMVNESLKQYLLTNTDIAEEKISSLLAYEEEQIELSDTEQDIIIDALDSIKIIDPACGSGAFPMGILQKMLLILQKIDPESKKWANKKLARIDNFILQQEFKKKVEEGNWDYLHKLGIIQNSIYGVDIQSIAIEISKLRFFLSLIVDENVDDSQPNRGIKPLPNLEFKFVCANSLIGLPGKDTQVELFEEAANVKKLRKCREEYFRAYGANKKRIEKEFQELQKRMFEASIPWIKGGVKETQSISLSQWNPFSGEPSQWFDPDWMFGIKDGFDIVIANPPYKVVNKKEQNIYKHLSTINCSDLYAYFFEMSISGFLKEFGCLSFITASLYIKGLKFEILRKYLEKNVRIISLKITGDNVFKNVQMPTSVFIGIKKISDSKIWNFEDFLPNSAILRNIEKNSAQLQNVSTIMRGIEIGRNLVGSSGDNKIITGSDIEKWTIRKLSYISNEVAFKYKKNDFYFEGDRILIRETGGKLISIFIDSKLLCNRSIYSIKVNTEKVNPKYIAAILNSQLMQFYYETKFKSETELFPKIRIAQVKLLPIKIIDEKIQERYATLVDNVISINKEKDYLINPEKQNIIKNYANQIDQMVYQLYGLTEEEIDIVENLNK